MPAADYRILTDATGQRIAMALEGISVDRAAKTDLTSILATGTTNTTGATITAGTYFYLNGTLVRALIDIASGATFTSGTNYEVVTAGSLNELKYTFTSSLPTESGVTKVAGRCAKQGNLCTVYYTLQKNFSGQTSTNVTLATLPSGYWPKIVVRGVAYNGTKKTSLMFFIEADGSIAVITTPESVDGAAQNIMINATFDV